MKSEFRYDFRFFTLVFIFQNLVTIFFLFLMFARRDISGVHALGMEIVGYILLVTILGVVITSFLEKCIKELNSLASSNKWNNWPITNSHAEKITVYLRALISLWLGYLDILLLKCYYDLFYEMIVYKSFVLISFIVITFFLGFIPWRVSGHAFQYKLLKDKISLWLFGGCLIIPLFYLMVLAFSYSIFPYIPATRGGGDYSQLPNVVFQIKSKDFKNELNEKYFSVSSSSQHLLTVPVILIDETSSFFYIADPNENGGAENWRKNSDSKPEIIGIAKSEVSGIKITRKRSGNTGNASESGSL
ncbi:MAG: hypothetical protein HQM08_30610 [Candidatus Riflebacteria bacterium]|nr:hypothetical protein [Candidatus Riflebacteria bacterium]